MYVAPGNDASAPYALRPDTDLVVRVDGFVRDGGARHTAEGDRRRRAREVDLEVRLERPGEGDESRPLLRLFRRVPVQRSFFSSTFLLHVANLQLPTGETHRVSIFPLLRDQHGQSWTLYSSPSLSYFQISLNG